MKKTFKRVVAGILILVTCMSSFVYGTEFDELYRGENLGALWYSELDSDGTGVNQMEGLVYIDGVLTAVPAVCINPDVPGMAELEYGDLYSSNISVANSSLRKAMFYGHSTAASAAMKAEYYEDYEDVSLALAEARGYGGGYAYLVTHHAAAKIYGDPLWNSGGYGTTISQALQNDCIAYIERIANLPEPPEIYEVHVAKKTDYQDYAFEIIKPIEKGHLTLKKVSGNPGLSDGNRCYSIVGTTYEVYDNANLSGSPIATLVVKDEEGNTDLVKVGLAIWYNYGIIRPRRCIMIPKIIPIKELKNTSHISEMCRNSSEPIFVTKNGYSEMVVMSIKTYAEKIGMQAIYDELAVSESQFSEGKSRDAKAALADLRKKYDL